MYPIAIQTDHIYLSSYTLLLDLGVLIALAIFWLRARSRLARPERWLDGALIALIGGVLGGRLGYVWANWSYFVDRQSRILKFWQGGLSWQGALVGVLVLIAVYCLVRKLSFWRLADELAFVAPILSVSGWLGCLMVGCAYGREQFTPSLFAAELPDLFGVLSYRINVQLIAVIWSLVVGIILWAVRNPDWHGATVAIFLTMNGIGLSFIDSLRGDAVPLLGNWRLDVLFDWTTAIIGIFILIGCRARFRAARKREGTL